MTEEIIPKVSAEKVAVEQTPIYDEVWMETALEDAMDRLRNFVRGDGDDT